MKWNAETLNNCNTLTLFCCLLCNMLNRVTDQAYWGTIQLIFCALFYLGNLLILIMAWHDNQSLKAAVGQNKWATFIVVLPLIPLIYFLFRH